MLTSTPNADSLIGRVARELTYLPEEDLPLVVEFVEYLRRQRASQQKMSAAEIQAEAHRRALQMKQVPRAEVVARFQALTEAIRADVIKRGQAIEGDWQSD
jgi:hypothetical protein